MSTSAPWIELPAGPGRAVALACGRMRTLGVLAVHCSLAFSGFLAFYGFGRRVVPQLKALYQY